MIKTAWDDIKVAFDDFTSSDHNAMVTVIKAKIEVSSGAGAPTSTPSGIGYIYIDTTNLKIYIATGTTGSSDWKKVLSQ